VAEDKFLDEITGGYASKAPALTVKKPSQSVLADIGDALSGRPNRPESEVSDEDFSYWQGGAEFFKGLGRGLAGTALTAIEGGAGLVKAGADAVGIEGVPGVKDSAVVEWTQDAKDHVFNKGWLAAKKGYATTDAARFGDAGGSMLTFMVPGVGAASLATKAPVVAKALNLSQWGLASTVGAGEQVDRVLARLEAGHTVSQSDQNSAILWGGAVGLTEVFPVRVAMAPLKRLLGAAKKDIPTKIKNRIFGILTRSVLSGGAEGLQEAVASVMQDMIEKNIYNPDLKVGQSLYDEFRYGAGAGGLMRGVMEAMAASAGRRRDRNYTKRIREGLTSTREAYNQSTETPQEPGAQGASSSTLSIGQEAPAVAVTPRKVGEDLDTYAKRLATDFSDTIPIGPYTVKKGKKGYWVVGPEDARVGQAFAKKDEAEEFSATMESIGSAVELLRKKEAADSKKLEDGRIEQKALLEEARKTQTPFVFTADELSNAEAARLHSTRTNQGLPIKEQYTASELRSGGVSEAKVSALLDQQALTREYITPERVRVKAESKDINWESDAFTEFSRRLTGRPDLNSMNASQLSAMEDALDGLDGTTFEADPRAIPREYTEEQLDIARDRLHEGTTIGAIKRHTGVTGNRAAKAIQAALVEEGSLVRKGRTNKFIVPEPAPVPAPEVVIPSEVVAKLRGRLAKIAPDGTTLKLVESIQNGNADGAAVNRLVQLAKDVVAGKAPEAQLDEMLETLDHEIIHMLREADAFTDSEWTSLKQYAYTTFVPGSEIDSEGNPQDPVTFWQQAYNSYVLNPPDGVKPMKYVENVHEEAVAELFRFWAKDKDALLQVPPKVKSLMQRILDALKNFIGVMKDDKVIAEDILQRVESGEFGARSRNEVRAVKTARPEALEMAGFGSEITVTDPGIIAAQPGTAEEGRREDFYSLNNSAQEWRSNVFPLIQRGYVRKPTNAPSRFWPKKTRFVRALEGVNRLFEEYATGANPVPIRVAEQARRVYAWGNQKKGASQEEYQELSQGFWSSQALSDLSDALERFSPATPEQDAIVQLAMAVAAGDRARVKALAGPIIEENDVRRQYRRESYEGARSLEEEMRGLMYPPPGKKARYKLTKHVQQLNERVSGFRPILSGFTDEELTTIKTRMARNIVEALTNLPSASEMATVAYAGRGKRGWYVKSRKAIIDLFGAEHATRFTAVLAALSPQKPVEENLQQAIELWTKWIAAGRPKPVIPTASSLEGRRVQMANDPVFKMMLDTITSDTTDTNDVWAWGNNVLRSFRADDPTQIVLSGPKVNSFFLNLYRDMQEVTNDTWMANYAAIDKENAFSSRPVGRDEYGGIGGKSGGYLAYNNVTRRAAQILSKRTGDIWLPAEVQETIWSWSKALWESQVGQRFDYKNVTAAQVTEVPDFNLLFSEEINRRLLSDGGYQLKDIRDDRRDGEGADPTSAEGSGISEAAFGAHLTRAAKRLDSLYRRRIGQDAPKFSDTFRPKISALKATLDDVPAQRTVEDITDTFRAHPAVSRVDEAVEPTQRYKFRPKDSLAGAQMYHGGRTLTDPKQMDVQLTNPLDLFGPGFYLTDNYWLGLSYLQARPSTPEAMQSASVLAVKLKDNIRLLNLEKPLPPEVQAEFEQAFAMMREFGLDVVPPNGDDRSGAAWASMPVNAMTLAVEDKHVLSPADQSKFHAHWELLHDGLRSLGYDGFQHVGGGIAGDNEVNHNVAVLWEQSEAFDMDLAALPTREEQWSKIIEGGLADDVYANRFYDHISLYSGNKHSWPLNPAGTKGRVYMPRGAVSQLLEGGRKGPQYHDFEDLQSGRDLFQAPTNISGGLNENGDFVVDGVSGAENADHLSGLFEADEMIPVTLSDVTRTGEPYAEVGFSGRVIKDGEVYDARTSDAATAERSPHLRYKLTQGKRPGTSSIGPYMNERFALSKREPVQVAVDLAEQYRQEHGYGPGIVAHQEPPVTYLQRVADYLEDAEHSPDSAEVQASYDALIGAVVEQYKLLGDISIEPYIGDGDPYANSQAMLDDLAQNKHLYFYLTENGYGEGSDPINHPMLAPTEFMTSDGRYLLANDLFRVVHDFFGHAQNATNFGPTGEYNAFHEHASMVPPEAVPALAAETLAQNAWVNFGRHIRREDGSIPKRGDQDYIKFTERPYSDQKAVVIPTELLADDPWHGNFSAQDTQEMERYSLRTHNRQPVAVGIKAPNTSAFRRWFKDSKIVDADGKPMVVYHGSAEDFTIFKHGEASKVDGGWYGQGFYFTPRTSEASEYARMRDSREERFFGSQSSQVVMPVFLSMQNPYMIHRGMEPGFNSMKRQFRKDFGAEVFEAVAGTEGNPNITFTNNVNAWLAERGYDGVISINSNKVTIDELVVFEPTQIKSATGNDGSFSPTNPDIRYRLRHHHADTTDAQRQLIDDMYTSGPHTLGQVVLQNMRHKPGRRTNATIFRQKFFDKFARMAEIGEQAAKTDRDLYADTSAIGAARFAERSVGILASAYNYGIPVYKNGFTEVVDLKDENGENLGGLIKIMERVGKENLWKEFGAYSAAKRAARLKGEKRENFLTEAQIQTGLSIGQTYEWFEGVRQKYQRWNNGIVQFMVDTGVLDKKGMELWTEHQDYVPFYREAEGEAVTILKGKPVSAFGGIVGVKPSKKLKGGTTAFKGDWVELVTQNARAAIDMGMKNVAAQRAIRDAKTLGLSHEVKKPGDADVSIRVKGKTRHFVVDDPLLIDSLTAMAPTDLTGFMRALALPSQFLREMVTRDPGFMLANGLRDTVSAWVTTGRKFTPFLGTARGAVEAVYNSKTNQALQRSGAYGGHDFVGDIKNASKAFKNSYSKNPLIRAWGLLNKATEASDAATRNAVYKATLKETGNPAQAAFEALEVINFSRKGSSKTMRTMTALVPFLNARLQGLDIIYRAYKGDGTGKGSGVNKKLAQRRGIARGALLMLSTMVYYSLMSDEDEYKNAPDHERDGNWLVKHGKNTFKLPIPFEIGVLFKLIPERLMAYASGQDTGSDLRGALLRATMETLRINPLPQAIVPAIEAIANYSFYQGRAIEPYFMTGLDTKDRHTEYTSALSRAIGEQLGIPPIRLDHALRGYTGTLGSYFLTAMHELMSAGSGKVTPAYRIEQYPVIKRFLQSELPRGDVDKFYEMLTLVRSAKASINRALKSGDTERANELMQNKTYMKRYQYSKTLEQVARQISKINQMRNRIIVARDIQPTIKRQRLDELDKMKIMLTKQVSSIRKEIQ